MSTAQFRYVGKSLPRLDAVDKVAGSATYVADLRVSGCWLAGVVRSPVAAGRLKGFSLDPAFDWDSVVMATAADIPGANAVHMIRDDYEALVDEKITYATQPLALIAAPDRQTLRAALAACVPDIEAGPAALTIEDALAMKSDVWGENNVMDEFNINCGDVEKGFAEADVIVENTYRTGLQEHIYLETCGMIAWPEPADGVTVAGSLQCPHYVHNALVMALGLDTDKVSVRQTVTGGAFGGKEDYPSAMAVWVALLAKKSGRPVSLIYDRAEDMLTTPKRHPSKTVYRLGLKRDGTITAAEVDLLLDGGACTSMSKVVLARAVLHCTGAYKVPNARLRARAVATNTPPNGAFRGFGAPQAIYAVERQMDFAAMELGLDPYSIRMKNVLRKGDAFPFGQVLADGASAALVLEDAVTRSDYLRKRDECLKQDKGLRVRKGIGLSLCMHGGGFTGAGEDRMGTTVDVEYLPSGAVEVLSGSTEMGQGTDTMLPMYVAEVLQLPLERVTHPLPDTSRAPNSGPTAASRTAMFVGRAAVEAGENLLKLLEDFIAEKKGVRPDAYRDGAFFAGGGQVATLDETAKAWLAERKERLVARGKVHPDDRYSWDEEKFHGTAYKGFSWLAQVLEIEVDLDTYEIHPLKSTVSTEVGRAVNPIQVEGQMAGGVLQSYGMGYLEEMTLTPEGKYSASMLSAYLIPTTLDTPEFDIRVFEDPSPFGAFGAKGIGELSCDGGAPAVAAAVDCAAGVHSKDAPLTGEKLFYLLEEKEGGA